MPRVTLEEAHARLPELLAALAPGEELEITQGEWPVGKLVRQPLRLSQPRQPGSAKGLLVIHEDDDEHLKDFAEYM
jgi:antitoxin (DNA-binding transcriptional repressor) of toxin-antitoxin stability system